MKKSSLLPLVLTVVFFALTAHAATPIRVLPTNIVREQPPEAEIDKSVRAHIDVETYREVRVQLIRDDQGQPSHYLVYLLSKTTHRVDVVRMNVDKDFKILSVQPNYRLQKNDIKQQPRSVLTHDQHAACPDNTVEFVAFAPNDIQVEQDVTIEVAAAAVAANLKTVTLLKEQATRDAYLNYLSCSNVRGNFYDGDSNPDLFITVDGVITADEIKTILNHKFHFLTTNIWLACQAYNDPMLSAVVDFAETKMYAAGINNLAVGPSDHAAACAMKAAIAGNPMKASFDQCYAQLDIATDHWGFGGKGTDYFWSPGYNCTTAQPVPTIKFDHVDGAGRIYIPVTNAASYGNDLFDTASYLPACGLNTNSARTWVDIYDATNNTRIYGFCALGAAANLQNIWFMPNAGSGKAYVVINDRACGHTYKSNTVSWSKCQSGYYWNNTDSKCEKLCLPKKCAVGYVWDKTDCTCKKICKPVKCKAGYFWNPDSCKCEKGLPK